MENTATTNDTLLSVADSQAWRDWLFHIQTNLILSGYTETLTEAGRVDHAAYFTGLYKFIGSLQDPGKNS